MHDESVSQAVDTSNNNSKLAVSGSDDAPRTETTCDPPCVRHPLLRLGSGSGHVAVCKCISVRYAKWYLTVRPRQTLPVGNTSSCPHLVRSRALATGVLCALDCPPTVPIAASPKRRRAMPRAEVHVVRWVCTLRHRTLRLCPSSACMSLQSSQEMSVALAPNHGTQCKST